MKKAILVAGVVAVIVILVAAGVVLYAVRNLDSIIAQRRDDILARVSATLGRNVEVSGIKVALGWGIKIDLTEVRIADDPAISDQPFVEASDIYADVELIPLLSHHVRVTEVAFKNPQVHIIRTEAGELNVSTLGRRRNEITGHQPAQIGGVPSGTKKSGVEGTPLTSQAQPPAQVNRQRSRMAQVYVKVLSFRNGEIVYDERGPRPQTITVDDVNLSIKDFSLTSRFGVELTLALLSDQSNVKVTGTIGPLAKRGTVDLHDAPLNLQAKLGPILLARIRAVGAPGKWVPEKLSLPDPVTVNLGVTGDLKQIDFSIYTDLSSDRIAWDDSFNKPASVPLKLSVDGTRSDLLTRIGEANVVLGDLQAKAQNLDFTGKNLSARIDTNRFDVGALARLVSPLQKYNASGGSELHGNLQLSQGHSLWNGTVTLVKVSFASPANNQTLVRNLDGVFKIAGNSADAGPLKFDLASSHATFTIHARSLEPLNARYQFDIDKLTLADFIPSRAPDEHLNNLALNGTVIQANGAGSGEPAIERLALEANGTSSDGDIANINYKNLSVIASRENDQVILRSFQVAALNGQVTANGTATTGGVPQFALDLTASNVDLQQALQSQNAKVADIIRGTLEGEVQVTGRGSKLDQIKPTLRGNGRALVKNAKLIGVNVARVALKKANGIAGTGDLVPAAIVQNHPELFANPDTDIESASLDFLLQGPRLVTRDLLIQTQDYGLTGHGWFDMDKNIDLKAHIVLTPAFSREIIATKKNVSYVTNHDGQVDVPLSIQGRLPKPEVTPDVSQMAQRAGTQFIKHNGRQVLDKLIGKGGVLGGGSGGKSGNPLDLLKGLFR